MDASREQDEARELARRLANRRRVTERACVVCGRSFVGYAHRRYCSATCRQKAWEHAHPEKVREKWLRRKARQRANTPPTHTDTPPTDTSVDTPPHQAPPA